MIKISHINCSVLFCLVMGFSCNVKEGREELSSSEDELVTTQDMTQEEMTIKEFVVWCEDENNKLNKAKQISDMKFRLSCLPSETMAFLELRTEPYDLSIFRKACENYTEMIYFKFRMEVINGSGELLKYKLQSPSQYETRVRYASFEMQNDLYLVQGNDTLSPGLFQFERIFEIAPYASFMFAFDNKRFNKNNEFTIVYNDKLFDKGFVKFNYKNKQLTNLPNISEL